MDKNDKKKVEKTDEVEVEKVKEESIENTEVKELRGRISDLEAQVKRTLADYQNLEKRTRGEKRDMILMANRQLLLRILPVLDTLMLAAKHTSDQSITLSIKQFQDILKSEGVEKIEAIGKMFDPLIMECVGTRKGKEWEVLEEVKSGYRIGDIILRPAYVIAGKEKN